MARITLDAIIAAVEADDYIGICRACGQECMSVEPDAERYTCESCGKPQVYGAEQLLFMTAG